MPQAVVAVAAAAAGAAASSSLTVAAFGSFYLGSAALGSSLAGAVAAGAVNQIGSRMFSKTPKLPQIQSDAGVRTALIRSATEAHRIIYGQVRVGGVLIFARVTDSATWSSGGSGKNKYLHMVIALAGHEVEEIGQIYLNDLAVDLHASGNVITNHYFKGGTEGYVFIQKHLGTTSQAADSYLLANVPEWTSAHTLSGIAYLYVGMEFRSDVFPRGIPNVSAVVKGKKVYDPRSATTAWSANAALCVRDYIASDYGFNVASANINDTYTNAAANVCDESVALDAGGTESRYTCNGVISTEATLIDNLNGLITSLAGAVTYVGGKFRIHAGAYDTPAGAIDTTMLAGPMDVRLRAPRKELFNSVRGVFVDPNKSYQATDFPYVTNSTYVANDGGTTIWQDIELPFTTSSATAQRIAKIGLEKARQQIMVDIPVNYNALQYAAMDVVTLTDSALGWSSKPFRIRKWTFDPLSGITMTLQEESSASYDWSAEETTYDTAPDTTLPDPFTVQPPGAITVTESLYVTRNGDGVKARASMAWVAAPDAFLKEYLPEYKLTASSTWTKLPRTTATSIDIDDIAPGTYNFRVSAFNDISRQSDYSTSSQYINGLLDPPTEPQNLTIATIGGLAVLSWDAFSGQTNLDVKLGGRIEFRHTPDTSNGWTSSTTIGIAAAGNATQVVLPLKPGKYLAKCVDSSGIYSTTAASVTTEQATALTFANLSTITEHSAFSGTKTNCFVSGSVLTLGGSGLFDDIADLDTVASLDYEGGVASEGTYIFSAGYDAGSKTRWRATGHILASIVNVLDFIDSRSGNIDDWGDFDGTVSASADAQLYIRVTDDNPSGSPTWGSWQRIDSAEYYNRASQFKCVLTSDDPIYNIQISELTMTIDGVV